MSSNWYARAFRLVFVVGPSPLDRVEDQSTWDSLLTWPARLLLVAGALAVAWVWADTPGGVQLGWGLQYGLTIGVSIVASFWFLIGAINAVASIFWLIATRRPPASDGTFGEVGWDWTDSVAWVNRQVSHAEALGVWVAIAFILSPRLTIQVPCCVAVLLLGEPIIDGLARSRLLGSERARQSRAGLMIERRWLIYLATFVGLLFLGAQAFKQWVAFLPLVASVGPGLVLRSFRARQRKVQEREAAKKGQGQEASQGRLARANMQRSFAPWAGQVMVLGGIVAVLALSFWQRQRLEGQAHGAQDGPPPPTDACAREAGGPVVPTLALYLIADTQLHELGGFRFPGQMEVATTLVSVARRPVELDMLSTATVVRTQAMYEGIAADRAKRNLLRPLWAHLGDFADLSCIGEMERMLGLLSGFGGGVRLLAGVAPGNHDSSFTGNFGWSPYWDRACSGRLDKKASDRLLKGLLDERLVLGGTTFGEEGWQPAGLIPGPLWRFTISRLGTLPVSGGRERGVVAIFVDTADRKARDFGVAGSFGTFSELQQKAILEEVAKMKTLGQAGAWGDPWYVLFAHHPYAELTSSSRDALNGLIAGLEQRSQPCPPGDDACPRPRVLTLVTAHTHTAEAHRHCVGQRMVREIVVGSVIDPPQQAALLEIGMDARGRAAARLSTLPTVGREGLTCDAEKALGAASCHRVMGKLAAAPACQELVEGPGAGQQAGASCEELERPLPLDQQIEGIVRNGGPRQPDELEAAENRRARTLLRCVCRDLPNHPAPSSCGELAQPPPGKMYPEVLAGEGYAKVIEALARDSERADEMTCLAWAASVVQSHKPNGMTMADALRCAFDDPTMQPAQVTVATAEDVPCR